MINKTNIPIIYKTNIPIIYKTNIPIILEIASNVNFSVYLVSTCTLGLNPLLQTCRRKKGVYVTAKLT